MGPAPLRARCSPQTSGCPPSSGQFLGCGQYRHYHPRAWWLGSPRTAGPPRGATATDAGATSATGSTSATGATGAIGATGAGVLVLSHWRAAKCASAVKGWSQTSVGSAQAG